MNEPERTINTERIDVPAGNRRQRLGAGGIGSGCGVCVNRPARPSLVWS